jgi:photosystem II stability/assembly factor-like uncharacterized protein
MLSRGDDDDEEPSLALGADGSVYVTANRNSGRTVLWVSKNGGATFEDPIVPHPGGTGDVQIAADDSGRVYITGIGKGLDLTASRDGGRTFTTRTIESLAELRDKPELTVSRNGRDLYVACDGRHGPTVMLSHDGAVAWERSRVVVTDSLHNRPTALVLADQRVYFTASTFILARLADPITENTMRIFSTPDGGRTWAAQILGRGPRVYGGCVYRMTEIWLWGGQSPVPIYCELPVVP